MCVNSAASLREALSYFCLFVPSVVCSVLVSLVVSCCFSPLSTSSSETDKNICVCK